VFRTKPAIYEEDITTKTRMRQTIERFQALLELGINEYELKKESWKNINFDSTQKEVGQWHRMKELKFPEDEIPELEAYNESVTINGSLTILEDEYEQTTIWRRIVPTKKPIYVTTRIEKVANEGMEIMYDFIKKHFQ
jgi:hypothetical protein